MEKLHNRLQTSLQQMQINYEVVFINDGSKDKTLPLVLKLAQENPSLRYIDLSRNFGHQLAIFAGIENARGEYILVMDGDG